MQISSMLLTKSPYNRSGKELSDVLGVVMHWTGAPLQTASEVRDYFESLGGGREGRYASSHFIVGIRGEVVQCIPTNEVAYHCGSHTADPASGKIYTDEARRRFGKFAEKPTLTPNYCTIGIELCALNSDGEFNDPTTNAAAKLVARLLLAYRLDTRDVTTHHDVVGWKDCPRLWTQKPQLFSLFKERVKHEMAIAEAIGRRLEVEERAKTQYMRVKEYLQI